MSARTEPTPCHEDPDLFSGDGLTNSQRRQAVRLCKTKCPAAMFAWCQTLTPEPGFVMAGVAYNASGVPVRALHQELPAEEPAERQCIGISCTEILPPPTEPAHPNLVIDRVWCSPECRARHRLAERRQARREAAEREARELDRAVSELITGAVSWDRASRLVRTELVRRLAKAGWSDPEMAERFEITARKVRWIRQRAEIPGNNNPARPRLLTSC